MTPVFCCGFECGIANAHLFLGPGASFSTSIIRNGLRSGRTNATATTSCIFSTNNILSGTVHTWRFYIYFTSLPTQDSILSYTNAGIAGVGFKVADSKIYPIYDGVPFVFGSTGVSVTTGTWYLIDVRTNLTANPWTIDVSVNGTTTTQLSVALASPGAVANIKFGAALSASGDIDHYFDDVIISQTSVDYPIGAGKVLSFVPNADGTHTCTTTTIVKGTIAAPTGGGNVAGSTDTFNWVNGRPLLGGATDNTRLVNQQTNASTLYAEVAFEDTTETSPPRAVEVITADRQAATTVGDMTVKLNDNGTENTILNRLAAAGVITDRFTRKHYATPPTGGAWNIAASGNGSFQNIRARFGYSPDATPDQYWRGIMIEAEFVDPIPTKIVQVKQAVNRANTY